MRNIHHNTLNGTVSKMNTKNTSTPIKLQEKRNCRLHDQFSFTTSVASATRNVKLNVQ